MSIIFFRFFLLFSVVANRVGPKTRYHRACSRSLTSLVLSRSLLRYCTKLCLLGFSAISASFSRNFSGLWAGLGSCFGDFCGFSYFFLDFFSAFESSPNLCVNSSSSYISPSMLPLSSGDLIEWSLVCHSILSYQKFCD